MTWEHEKIELKFLENSSTRISSVFINVFSSASFIKVSAVSLTIEGFVWSDFAARSVKSLQIFSNDRSLTGRTELLNFHLPFAKTFVTNHPGKVELEKKLTCVLLSAGLKRCIYSGDSRKNELAFRNTQSSRTSGQTLHHLIFCFCIQFWSKRITGTF